MENRTERQEGALVRSEHIRAERPTRIQVVACSTLQRRMARALATSRLSRWSTLARGVRTHSTEFLDCGTSVRAIPSHHKGRAPPILRWGEGW